MRIKTFYWILFCVTVLTTNVLGQPKSVELIGRIILEDGNNYSYKLNYTDSAGIIRGTSTTDIGGKYETEAIIRGIYNAQKKSLNFSEKKIVYSKYKTTEFCLLNFSGKMTEQKGLKIIRGKVTGYLNGKKDKPCGKGTVVFSTAEDIFNISKQLLSLVDTSKLEGEQKAQLQALKKETEKVTYNRIDDKNKASFKWYSDSLTIEVFDDGEVDYDIVTITIDGNPIFEKLSLTKETAQKTIGISPGIHTLKFRAEHEGSIPPNTAKSILYDGDIRHIINSSTTYGKEAVIVIEK